MVNNNIKNIIVSRKKRHNHINKHVHDHLELIYVFDGTGIEYINNKKHNIKRGDLLLVNIKDLHAVIPNPYIDQVNIEVPLDYIDKELVKSHNAIDLLTISSFDSFRGLFSNFLPVISFKNQNLLYVEEILNHMIYESDNVKTGSNTILRSYLHILLVHILRQYSFARNALRSDLDDAILTALKKIEENYNKKLTLEDLAKESFYNPSYFGKMFKDNIGMTPIEFVTKKRMKRAKQLLLEKNDSIESISLSIGYSNRKQFYRQFKNETGLTPGQYRKTRK